MAISAAAKSNHDQLFGDRVSALGQSDPELIEYFGNFAFDEVHADAARLDETLDLRTRLMVQLAAILAVGGLPSASATSWSSTLRTCLTRPRSFPPSTRSSCIPTSSSPRQAFNAEHGIVTQAWSPIGGITFYREGEHTSTLEDPTIVKIAESHSKSPAQVMLRWHLQEGRSVIPKSTKPRRIAENFDVFDFECYRVGVWAGLRRGNGAGQRCHGPEPGGDDPRYRHSGGFGHRG
jgi:hypothetical protein